MLANIGQFNLIVAFVLALLLAIVPMVAYAKDNTTWMQLAKPLAYVLFIVVFISFLILIALFVLQDFTVTYVWKHSSLTLPLRYRITATWGAHEGSILMWITIQALWVAAVAKFSKGLKLDEIARVLSVLGIITAGFIAFILFTSNPFERTFPAPFDGNDLNPLLQDFGMIVHPPLLYFGYVGLSVAFALSVAALIGGKIDEHWIRWSRKWTNLAWAFLTMGIILGSWWAYYELGWGGWWFWDPVENASFLPWLAGTALIHVQAVSERKNAFRGWTVLLAITAFSLSVLGTFLVRSGSITSVHSFAADPTRGLFILGLLTLFAGGALTLFAWRANKLKSTESVHFDSKEFMLLCNSLIFIVATFTVLLGTIFPMIFEAMGQKISVGAPYFGLMFFLIMIPMAMLLPLGTQIRWHKGSLKAGLRELMPYFVMTLILTGLVIWLVGDLNVRGSIGILGAFWVFVATTGQLIKHRGKKNASFIGMTVAHWGVAMFLFGMSMVEHADTEKDVLMKPGQVIELNDLSFEFKGVQWVEQENYRAQQGQVIVSQDNTVIDTLRPQKRHYPKQQNPMTEASIYPGFTRDIYVSLGEQVNDQGAWAVRIYIKPFIRWMWFGGILMLSGALIALFSARIKRAERQQHDRLMSEALELK
ncbi:heme lyase CcmF/NrfE family subunit [Marinicella rhabdoformis]|uniref:heme lyase CcmF/NrfE family subunit n=1 Tax=Marinicella rhabdoformis TaxID=2580566 RepID=UPI0012AED42D|nr:heme lyase CcmF/NrfE family subunit [Marinicella rhabdoformis]